MTPEQRRYLAAARVARLATADADGRPHAVPVCFALVEAENTSGAAPTTGDASGDTPAAGSDDVPDGAPTVVTPLDEKPKDADPTRLRRVRDVCENPRVALVADHYREEWSRLGWVQVRGTARVLDPGDSGHGDPEHDDAVAALRAKYDQYADHDLDTRPVIAISVGHVVSWGDLDAGPGDI